MRLLFVADGRSPIALNWIRYFVDADHEVHLVSTFPCTSDLRLASLSIIPVAFSGVANEPGVGTDGSGLLKKIVPVDWRTSLRQWLGPLTLPAAARRLRQVIMDLQPDLVHAMRIPYEGMLAALALNEQSHQPLLVSIWGNDFTLHAPSNPWMGGLTRRTLARASALHADCHRDVRLAVEWGFDPAKASIVLPGGGGIQMDVFFPPSSQPPTWRKRQWGGHVGDQPARYPRLCAQRSLLSFDPAHPGTPSRGALSMLQHGRPDLRRSAGWRRWVWPNLLQLLPHQPRSRMAEIFRSCQVVVSPTTHDGTPNSLLEAMACGCFPVVGNIESLREWITDGRKRLSG